MNAWVIRGMIEKSMFSKAIPPLTFNLHSCSSWMFICPIAEISPVLEAIEEQKTQVKEETSNQLC